MITDIFKFIFIVTKVYIVFAVLWILGLFALPIALFQTPREGRNLPRWAFLWDNLDDGINGNRKHEANCKDLRSRWCRFRWLHVRNPIHNFAWHVVGYTPSEVTKRWYYGKTTGELKQGNGVHLGFVRARSVKPELMLRYSRLYVRIGFRNSSSHGRLSSKLKILKKGEELT